MIALSSLLAAVFKYKSAVALKAFIPAAAWIKVRNVLVGASVARCPDRIYLEQTLLPTLGAQAFKKVLFIGCECYTRHYGNHFTAAGSDYWTTDIRPEAAPFGAPGKHITCDVKEIDQHFAPDFQADLVIFNGVFGYGINTEADMNCSLLAIRRIMRPQGILLLGWNRDLAGEPQRLSAMSVYQNIPDNWLLPQRVDIDNSTHAYAFYEAV